MKLIILASGKAERLVDIHQNCYPKILLNLGNSILLEEMVNAYPDVKEVHIVLNSRQQIDQVKEIIAAKNLKQQFIFWDADKDMGIAEKLFLLSEVEGFPTEDVMISWSDIYPKQPVVGPFKNDTIFVDNVLRHRMSFVNEEIVHCHNNDGNLCGLFYIKNLKNVFKVNGQKLNDVDFADVLGYQIDHSFKFDKQFINLVDTGDMQKYVQLLDDVDIRARFFNDLKINEDSVTKTAITESGKVVIQNEIDFYKKSSKHYPPMPKLIDSTESSLTIEKINGNTIYQEIAEIDPQYSDKKIGIDLMKKFDRSISKLHEIKSPEFLHQEQILSIWKEYINVTEQRYLKCRNLLPIIDSVNGTKVNHSEVFEYLQVVFDKMTTDVLANRKVFKFIHGDTNTSNVMIDHLDQLVFIDPRGSFGNHKYYGDPKYDYAKFLYGLTGYDSFNLTKDVRFNYNSNNKSISYDCVKGYDINDLTKDKELKFLVGLIWLKLPYYTINNINKAIVAYSHGLKLLTESMKKYAK